MRYNVKFNAGFDEKSFCYFCYPEENTKSAIVYEAAMTGYEKANENYYMEREGYYNYLLNFTLSGKGRMIYGGREYVLKEGDLLFINCAQKHVFSAMDGEWEFVYLHVNGPALRHLYDAFCAATGNVFQNYNGRQFCSAAAKLHALLDSKRKKWVGNSYHIYLDGKEMCDVSEIVYAILMDVSRKVIDVRAEKPYALTLALDYIQKNFQRSLSLEEIAQKAYLSKFHFERMFTAAMGVTVHRYLADLRLNRAMWLLKTTDMPLADVAAEVGYSDTQALTKLFKKNLGLTPAVYRKNGDPY